MPLTQASLEHLLEASPDLVIATSFVAGEQGAARGIVAYYNDGARETLGYSRVEVIGRPVVKLYPSLEEARRVMVAMRDPAVHGRGRALNFPTRFVAKDGQQIPVAVSGVILYGPEGEEEGTIGFAKDLREIIRKDQLAVLGEIAIGLSHEINNPLEVITNQVSMLERFLEELPPSTQAPAQPERLASIRREVRRIEGFLDRLHQMAEQEVYASTDYIGDARMIDLSREQQKHGPLAGRRILVVDDDRGVRDSVAELLRSEGCEVETASNGRIALRRLETLRFDVVLSDVVMPEIDGYELFQAVRRTHPGTKVILMTAFYYDKDHVIKRARLQGLEDVLFKKPIQPDRLRAMLSGMLTPPRRDPSAR